MTEDASEARRRRWDTPLAVAITLVIQTLISLLAACIPILAPEIARTHGWHIGVIAFYVPLLYATAFLVNFKVPWLLARFGGMGLSLICVASSVAGLLCVLPASPAWIFLAPITIGIAAGAMNPATSQILAPRTQARSAGFVMGLKQSGIPLGAMIAGASLPLLMRHGAWQTAVWYLVLLSAATIAVLLPSLRWLNGPAESPPPRPHGLLGPVKQLLALPGMAAIAVSGAIFSAMLACLRSFLTVYLVTDLHLSLATAGLAFSASQAAGIVGQVGWAAISDRVLTPPATMAVIGILLTAAGLLSGALTPAWPVGAVVAVAVIFGVSAAGFVPVVLGEVARRAAPGQAGILTGGANLFLFGGIVAGPLLFGAAAWACHYSGAFLAMAACALVAAMGVAWFGGARVPQGVGGLRSADGGSGA